MKKLIMLLSLIPLYCSCDDDKIPVNERIDYYYTRSFTVGNETSNRVIVITNNYPHGSHGKYIALTPEEEKIMYSYFETGDGNDETDLADDMANDSLNLMSAIAINGSLFSMTIDGEVVSNDIWLRKNWWFSSDSSSRTYTLTVTDDLLDNLVPKEAEQTN